MTHRWRKRTLACLLALALLTTLGIGCGNDEGDGKETIVIGNLTDMTGPGATALVPMTWALQDMVNEINEQELIPGVTLKVENYDTALDSARFIPGYEWLKGKGAQVMVSVFSDCSETLKPYAERDKIAILGMATTEPMIEDPGWVFGFCPPNRYCVRLLMQWLSDKWEADGKTGKPKIATVGWADSWGTDQERGAREYCEAHPDDLEYVGAYLAPVGTLTWSGEVAETKDCDYINLSANGALQPATFIDEYFQKGGTGTFVSTEAPSAYVGYITESAGWEAVDGHFNVQTWGWWNLPWPKVEYAKEVLQRYHPDEADELTRSGMGYLGGGLMQLFALEILVEAVNSVGVGEFDGQAYYDTAVDYTKTWEGFSERGFTETRRYVSQHNIVLEWRADQEDLVKVSDWLPVIAAME